MLAQIRGIDPHLARQLPLEDGRAEQGGLWAGS